MLNYGFEKVTEWFQRQPPILRGVITLGGIGVMTFSGRLPDHFQDICLWLSFVIALGGALSLFIPLLKKHIFVGYVCVILTCVAMFESINIGHRLSDKLATTRNDLLASEKHASDLSYADEREIQVLNNRIFFLQSQISPQPNTQPHQNRPAAIYIAPGAQVNGLDAKDNTIGEGMDFINNNGTLSKAKLNGNHIGK